MNSKIFSLEIFVDRIRLSTAEKCLFPATILKWLSYEPALISTIERSVQDNLREYIEPIERSGKINQINELKDPEGNFSVRKGKSILFEADTVSLMNELNVLPIYILLVDDYYFPSHLVGVVAVNMSSVMNRLSQKMSHRACTVSEETCSRFPLLNLMGEAVGVIALCLRLVFVGDNIGRHVAQEQEMTIRIRPMESRDVAHKSVSAQLISLSEKNEEPFIQQTKAVVRNFGCQVDEKRSIRVQVQPNLPHNMGQDRSARIGLTIDPNDPLLEGPPPLIYNSHYDKENSHYEVYTSPRDNNSSRYLHEDKDISICHPHLAPRMSSAKVAIKNMPVLNALYSELKEWKSEDFVEENVAPKKSSNISRSKSVDICLPKKSNPKEFLQRMSKPKVRPLSPTGMVPKNLGWIRTEPQFVGPRKSSLEYKLTKTQLRRMEIKNPRSYERTMSQDQWHKAEITKKVAMENIAIRYDISSKDRSNPTKKNDDLDNTTTSYTERTLKERHPLVPPLFNPGTSISVPTFTQSDSSSQPQRHRENDTEDKIQRLPPRSPDRQRNNNTQTMSYETNGTLEEADHFLNLNPVQSNRSPQMTIRSQTMPIDNESEENNESQEDDNRSDEYSDDLNGSFSSSNGPRSVSRRPSNVSQISQTSEWRTEYSRGSSMSQTYLNKADSPPQSPDLGTYRSPPKSPIRSRKSLLASGVVPGGRFTDLTSSRNLKSSDGFAASFDESAERTNYTTTGSGNLVTERGRDHSVLSSEPFEGNPSQLRPASIGGDVTSFTKVTKFDRSLAPGRQSNNYLGTNYLTSTVASMQTNDSQMLTSDSFD